MGNTYILHLIANYIVFVYLLIHDMLIITFYNTKTVFWTVL